MADRDAIFDPATQAAMRELGEVIYLLRKMFGLTQKQLADLAGVSQSTISRIENGRAPLLRLYNLARIMAAMDYPGDWPRPTFWIDRKPAWELLMDRFEARRRQNARRTKQPYFPVGRRARFSGPAPYRADVLEVSVRNGATRAAAWRRAHEAEIEAAELEEAELAEAELAEAELAEAHLAGAHLAEAHLAEAELAALERAADAPDAEIPGVGGRNMR